MSSVSVEDQWKDFKSTHNKSYSDEEDGRRFQIFKDNVEKIEAHNKKYESGEVTFKMGINKFADLTAEEMKSYKGLAPLK
ncbi:protein CTLA-2-beta-like [Diorhabda carinulata]|uniref:protein CTLA-2-beta-like n=1 Tax=Diorhabda carinulata TaxID=1163345 RepID=UPI0025A0027E|nr:protein CTLA-2-beta-like [Diorhabda carinulata]